MKSDYSFIITLRAMGIKYLSLECACVALVNMTICLILFLLPRLRSDRENIHADTASANEQPGVRQFTNEDKIQIYKEMLDDGLITQEEFEAKKKQLLDL